MRGMPLVFVVTIMHAGIEQFTQIELWCLIRKRGDIDHILSFFLSGIVHSSGWRSQIRTINQVNQCFYKMGSIPQVLDCCLKGINFVFLNMFVSSN